MSPTDVAPSAEMILRNEWGVRRDWLAFAAAQPECVPIVAEADGSIVATGVGTASGLVGWIGTIFVEPARRGQGLGRAITQAIIDRLEAAGCRTLVLVATAEGRRLYERMGFDVHTRYRILEAPGLPPGGANGAGSIGGGVVRPFEAADLDQLGALDAQATGEDRRHALLTLANPASTKVLVGPDGDVRGYVCRPPWGGGATIARTADDALAIADARRRTAGPAGKVRVGILRENEEGHDRLVAAGWKLSWSAPRMIRGEQIDWHPEWIWGQFNHAMG